MCANSLPGDGSSACASNGTNDTAHNIVSTLSIRVTESFIFTAILPSKDIVKDWMPSQATCTAFDETSSSIGAQYPPKTRSSLSKRAQSR